MLVARFPAGEVHVVRQRVPRAPHQLGTPLPADPAVGAIAQRHQIRSADLDRYGERAVESVVLLLPCFSVHRVEWNGG